MSSRLIIYYSQQHIIVIVFLLISVVVIYYLYTYQPTAAIEATTTENNDYENKIYPKHTAYKVPNISIRDSAVGGRGIFAEQDYTTNDIIEISPSIKQKFLKCKGAIVDYIFGFGEDDVLIAFGYSSIYNHNDDPNATFELLNEHQVKIVAVKPIKKDTEICISYGDDYFSQRPYLTQTL